VAGRKLHHRCHGFGPAQIGGEIGSIHLTNVVQNKQAITFFCTQRPACLMNNA
jgi:hypothetical protein